MEDSDILKIYFIFAVNNINQINKINSKTIKFVVE